MTHYIFDCDDVLLDWMGGFLNYVRRCGINPDPAGPKTWDMSEWLDTTPSYARSLIMDFNESPAFCALDALPGAGRKIRMLVDAGHTISVLSSCGDQSVIRVNRAKNLNWAFGNVFGWLICLPLGSSKFDWLYQFTRNVDPKDVVFVEDNYQHALSGVTNGIKSYCIRKRHNRYDEMMQKPSSVIWIDHISEVV